MMFAKWFSRCRWFSALLLLAMIVIGFGACQDSDPGAEPEGTAEFRLALVPFDVQCVHVSVRGGMRAVMRLIDVTPGTSMSFPLAGLPTGDVAVSGEAFDVACAAVTPQSVPTWIGDDVAVRIPAGVLTPIAMTFRRNGRIDISIVFDGAECGDGGCGGSAGTAGASGTGGAAGTSGAGGETIVGGILNQDTNWTAAGSPYRLAREVQVAANATLTIGPGTRVEGDGFAITTWGTLRVDGIRGAEVRFHDVTLNPGSSGSTPAVMVIDHAILDGGALWYATGGAYGSLTLTNSVVRDTRAGSYLYIWYPQANCRIEGNVFIRAGGISIGSDGRAVVVKNNAFYRPTTDFAIENWASYRGASITVTRNTFLDATALTLRLLPDHDSALLDARDNYWSTTDPAVIAGMIFDQNDDLRCASIVSFEPFLSAPDPATPDPMPWLD